MPTFQITAPDGTKYRVEAPEGASEQDALARVQAQHTPNPPQTANARVAESFGALPKPAGQSIAESLQAGDLATGNPLAPPLTEQKSYPPIGPAGPEMLGKAAGAAALGTALGTPPGLAAGAFVGRNAIRAAGVAGLGYAASKYEDMPPWARDALKGFQEAIALGLTGGSGTKSEGGPRPERAPVFPPHPSKIF